MLDLMRSFYVDARPTREQLDAHNKFMFAFAGKPCNYGDPMRAIDSVVSEILLSSQNKDGTPIKDMFANKIININSSERRIPLKDEKWVVLKALRLSDSLEFLKESFIHRNKKDINIEKLKKVAPLLDHAKKESKREDLIREIEYSFVNGSYSKKAVVKLIDDVIGSDQGCAEIKTLHMLKKEVKSDQDRLLLWKIFNLNKSVNGDKQSKITTIQMTLDSFRPYDVQFVKLMLGALNISGIVMWDSKHLTPRYTDSDYWDQMVPDPSEYPEDYWERWGMGKNQQGVNNQNQREHGLIPSSATIPTLGTLETSAESFEIPLNSEVPQIEVYSYTRNPFDVPVIKPKVNLSNNSEKISLKPEAFVEEPVKTLAPITKEELNFKEISEGREKFFDSNLKIKSDANKKLVNEYLEMATSRLSRMIGQAERLNLDFDEKMKLESIVAIFSEILALGDNSVKIELIKESDLSKLRNEYPLPWF